MEWSHCGLPQISIVEIYPYTCKYTHTETRPYPYNTHARTHAYKYISNEASWVFKVMLVCFTSEISLLVYYKQVSHKSDLASQIPRDILSTHLAKTPFSLNVPNISVTQQMTQENKRTYGHSTTNT